MIILQFDSEFLEIIKNGGEGNLRSSDIENPNPPKSMMWPTLEHSPQRLLIQQEKNSRINANFKVNDEEIIIQIISNGNIIKIAWNNILKVSIDALFNPIESKEILIELKDGKEIIITPSFIKRFIIKFYFIYEFISSINKLSIHI